MGTRRAQHPPPPQLLLLILLSCPWIQGKEVGAWGGRRGRTPEGSSAFFSLNILGLPSSWGKGRGTAKQRREQPRLSNPYLEPQIPSLEEVGKSIRRSLGSILRVKSREKD